MKFDKYIDEKWTRHTKMKNDVFVDIAGDVDRKIIEKLPKEVVKHVSMALDKFGLKTSMIKLEIMEK